jgi:flagellar basal-body rod modification protein FlgD
MSQSLSLEQAADAAAASIAATTSTSGTSAAAAASSVGNTALQQLGSNFNDFLNLLLTQVQNQDPTSPMDTDQFTTELVQFTGVQQQVATNGDLSQLISLQQSNQELQSAPLIGQQATVTAQQITLQNGDGEISFAGQAGQTAAIAIVDSQGNPIVNATVAEQTGTNTWAWNGQDNNGNPVADGAYRLAVETQAAGGTNSASVSYSVLGTITALSSTNGTTQLQLGGLSVPVTSLQAIN